jgi:hypothetical protein
MIQRSTYEFNIGTVFTALKFGTGIDERQEMGSPTTLLGTPSNCRPPDLSLQLQHSR